jgi:hypothetical protein
MTHKIFWDFEHSTIKPMGLDYHMSAAGRRGFVGLSSHIEKFIFPSLLCIVIYSQTAKNQAKGKYDTYHI